MVGDENLKILRLPAYVVARFSPRLIGSVSRFPAVSGYLSISSKIGYRMGRLASRAADRAQAR